MTAESRAALLVAPSPAAARRSGRRTAGAVRHENFRGGSIALTGISWIAPYEMGFEQWVLNGRRLGAVGHVS
jgi:hypothetical protein